MFSLSERYSISFNDIGTRNFKLDCKRAVKIRFASQWLADSQNVRKNPILWSYSLYKHGLYFEPYLNSISNIRHRIALTKLRTSSHVLEIERGRYTVPKTAVYDWLCKTCYQIQDEEHFLINCKIYDPLRLELYSKVSIRTTEFTLQNNQEKITFIMSCTDPFILNWQAKFVYKSFNKRFENIYSNPK